MATGRNGTCMGNGVKQFNARDGAHRGKPKTRKRLLIEPDITSRVLSAIPGMGVRAAAFPDLINN
jgi:hypothetical protein